ncbi:hypothetical protein FJ251_10390 [bacterium]|nr:hypothetical protein [bacterium]
MPLHCRPRLAVLVLLLPILVAATAQAGERRVGEDRYRARELRLNQHRGSAQEQVALALEADGGLIAVWESRRQQEGRYGVYARRLDALGSLRGPELPVNLGRGTHHQRPAVSAGAGGAWLVWEAWGLDGSAQGILGRRAGGDELLLNAVTAGSQETPSAIGLAGGLAHRLALWAGPGAEPGSGRIRGRLVDAQGAPIGDELALSESPGALDRLPGAAALPGGGFAVAWQRQVPGLPGAGGVYLRRFDAAGRALGEERLIAPGGIEPSLAGLPDGGLAIAWLEREDIDWRARLLRLAPDLAPRGVIAAPGLEQGGWQSGVAVATNAAGELVVAWNLLSPAGEEADVWARRYGASGAARGAAFRVNEQADGWQAMATATGATRLVLADDGRLAVAWAGDGGQDDEKGAHLTLLLPADGFRARLSLEARLALAALRERGAGRDAPAATADFAAGAALPHQPPVYDPELASGSPDPQPSWPGGGGRDAGWQAILNTGWTPPDPHLAVGPNHVLATTNGALAAFSKTGSPLWQLPIEGGGGFWGAQGAGGFVFDPEVIFDPIDQRFMAMACERTNNRSYFVYAVSASADPTGAWYKYRFDVTALAGNDIDSPNMAVDEQAVYLTADFFAPDTYLVYILSKASVLGGGAAVTTSVLHTGTQSMGLPVEVTDAPAMYMIHANESLQANSITFWAVQNPLGAPSLVSTALTVDTWWDPGTARSLGTSAQIETFEARFWSCVYRNGRLWACHHIAPTAARTSVAARWYEFDMRGWPTSGDPPTLVQSGTVQPGGSGFATFNSITVNAAGDAAMCFAYSSISEYLSIQRCYRRASDPLNTMQDPVRVKESTVAYTQSRWGDYSAIAVDPAGYEFWLIGEYALGSSNWSTWVSHFLEDLTAAPAAPLLASAGEAWPNPSRGETTLRFALGASARELRLEIFDAGGRRVRCLERSALPAGELSLVWDGRDETGRALPAGLYFTRLAADGERQVGPKLTLLR